MFLPNDISTILEQYYTSLYSPDSTDTHAAQDFLKEVNLPQINPTLLSQLNFPITQIEIHKMISYLENGKALGPDIYLPDFYTLTAQIVVPTLVKVFQAILQ